MKRAHNFKDITGQQFHSLIALNISKKVGKILYWLCQCFCGNKVEVTGHSLRSNHTKSCGCLQKTIASRNLKLAREIWILPEGVAGFNDVFAIYKRNAKIRNLSFNILKEDFYILTQQNCYYCNSPPKTKNHKFIYNGLDRKMNKIGYEINNVVTCCKICNRMKMSLDFNEFINNVNKITINLKEKIL